MKKVLSVLAILCAVGAHSASAATPQRVGDFALLDHKGYFHQLSYYDDQKAVAELNYFKDDWEARMSEAMTAYGDAEVVDAYVAQEHRATAYATQVALAVWGDDVERVQYQATRQNVIPFADRHDPEAERPAVQYSPTGWRGLVVNDGQSQQAFEDVFLPAYERMAE